MNTPAPPPDWTSILARAHQEARHRLMALTVIGAVGAVLLLAGGLAGRTALADDDPAPGGNVPGEQGSGNPGDTGRGSEGGAEGSNETRRSLGGQTGEKPPLREEPPTQPEGPKAPEPEPTEEEGGEGSAESSETPETPEPSAEPPPEEEFRAPR